MQDQALTVVVLAAGRGTRMRSPQAKVLQPLGSRPLLAWVLDAVFQLAPARLLVVVGFQAESVRRAFADPRIEFVLQEPQLGTGHAVRQCEEALADFAGDVLVLCGDMPLLKVETLKRLLARHRQTRSACTFLSLKTPEPRDFGRVIRDAGHTVLRIVEQRDLADPEKTVDEYNAGVYCFQKELLFKGLASIQPDNAQGEYYLTDILKILIQNRHPVDAVVTTEAAEIFGINSADDLKRAEQLLAVRR